MSSQTVHIQNLLYHLTPSLTDSNIATTFNPSSLSDADLQKISPTPLISFLENLTQRKIPFLRRGADAETDEGKAWNWKVVVGWWAWEMGYTLDEDMDGAVGNGKDSGFNSATTSASNLKEKAREGMVDESTQTEEPTRASARRERAHSLKRSRAMSHASVISSSELDDTEFIRAVERKVNELAQKVEMCKTWLQHEEDDNPEEITKEIRKQAPDSPPAGRETPGWSPRTSSDAAPLLDLNRDLRSPSPPREDSEHAPRPFSFATRVPVVIPELDMDSEVEESEGEVEDVQAAEIGHDNNGNASEDFLDHTQAPGAEQSFPSGISSPFDPEPTQTASVTPRPPSPSGSLSSSTTEGHNNYENSDSFALSAAQLRETNDAAETTLEYREVEVQFGVQFRNELEEQEAEFYPEEERPDIHPHVIFEQRQWDDLPVSPHRIFIPSAPLSQIDEESEEYELESNAGGRIEDLGTVKSGDSDNEGEEDRSRPTMEDVQQNHDNLSGGENAQQEEEDDLEEESTEDLFASHIVSRSPSRETREQSKQEEEQQRYPGAEQSGEEARRPEDSVNLQDPNWSAFIHHTLPPASSPPGSSASINDQPGSTVIPVTPAPQRTSFHTAESTPAPPPTPPTITVTRIRSRADSFPSVTDVGDTIDLELMRQELLEVAQGDAELENNKKPGYDSDDESTGSDKSGAKLPPASTSEKPSSPSPPPLYSTPHSRPTTSQTTFGTSPALPALHTPLTHPMRPTNPTPSRAFGSSLPASSPSRIPLPSQSSRPLTAGIRPAPSRRPANPPSSNPSSPVKNITSSSTPLLARTGNPSKAAALRNANQRDDTLSAFALTQEDDSEGSEGEGWGKEDNTMGRMRRWRVDRERRAAEEMGSDDGEGSDWGETR